MLRKYTSFFDPSLQYLGDNAHHFENAIKICDELVRLARNISILGYENVQSVSGVANSFSGGVIHDEEWCQRFIEVVGRTYRLESVFEYSTDSDYDEDLGHQVTYRRMILRLRFFVKNERKPFHTESFGFSRYDGEYLGDWQD